MITSTWLPIPCELDTNAALPTNLGLGATGPNPEQEELLALIQAAWNASMFRFPASAIAWQVSGDLIKEHVSYPHCRANLIDFIFQLSILFVEVPPQRPLIGEKSQTTDIFPIADWKDFAFTEQNGVKYRQRTLLHTCIFLSLMWFN